MMDRATKQGVYFALTAYIFWGVVPVYFKWVDTVSPWEILSHRIVWALILLLGILAYTGNLNTLKVSWRRLPMLFLTAGLLSINWLIFIYAVVNDAITETSLGYFINPLVSVLLGVIFLKERLRPLQVAAISVAAVGITVQLVLYGKLPWIALTLAFSFGFYGLFRKNLGLHPIGGLAVETMIVAPLAVGYLIWLAYHGTMQFGNSLQLDLLLILGGFVTSFPLLCFAAAVNRLSLTAMGMFQYIAPSLSLLLAVFAYGEPFTASRAATFICIWIALMLFTAESWHHHRRLRERGIEGI